jgi:ketosteroid isomerase-like protein/heme-degrading monooxygenase HmoA
MSSATPADVLARRRHLTLGGDADGLADLFAPDAVIDAPFGGAPGMPMRLEGRERIREYTRQVMASPLRLEDYEVVELYQTQDPEVVIVEMRAMGTVTTTGRSFVATSIQILRIREGHIVLFRDFANPRGLEDVIGEPRPELETPMFARVIMAQPGREGFDGAIRLVQEQLPGARQQPGFKGFYLLTDPKTGRLITISLWENEEQMPTGIRGEGTPAAGRTPTQLETYEVNIHI